MRPFNKKEKKERIFLLLGGTKQIRTAVIGFADRCLTSRPWYHEQTGVQSYKNFPHSQIGVLFPVVPGY